MKRKRKKLRRDLRIVAGDTAAQLTRKKSRERFREILESMGIGAPQLSGVAGVSKDVIFRVIKGSRTPSPATLLKIIDGLNRLSSPRSYEAFEIFEDKRLTRPRYIVGSTRLLSTDANDSGRSGDPARADSGLPGDPTLDP